MTGPPVNKIETRAKSEGVMRIGGKKVDADGVVPVHYPYTGEMIGTVPAGRAEHAARAFEIAAGYQAEAHALRAPADSVQHRRTHPRAQGRALRSHHA